MYICICVRILYPITSSQLERALLGLLSPPSGYMNQVASVNLTSYSVSRQFTLGLSSLSSFLHPLFIFLSVSLSLSLFPNSPPSLSLLASFFRWSFSSPCVPSSLFLDRTLSYFTQGKHVLGFSHRKSYSLGALSPIPLSSLSKSARRLSLSRSGSRSFKVSVSTTQCEMKLSEKRLTKMLGGARTRDSRVFVPFSTLPFGTFQETLYETQYVSRKDFSCPSFSILPIHFTRSRNHAESFVNLGDSFVYRGRSTRTFNQRLLLNFLHFCFAFGYAHADIIKFRKFNHMCNVTGQSHQLHHSSEM